MTEEHELSGGGVNVVVRVGDTVRRPAHPWTPNVARLLESLRAQGLTAVPRWLGLDEQGREILDHLPGEVGNYPLPVRIRGESALVTSARLLRSFHDATVPVLPHLSGGWQLLPMEPAEVICHGDFAPYNCVYDDKGVATGIIDFDLARPGPRWWDLAYALYRFAPLTAPGNPDGFGDAETQGARAARFLAAHGCTPEEGAEALARVPERLTALVSHMRSEAEKGDPAFARHIEAGHADLYLRDLEHIRASLPSWTASLSGEQAS